jgi:hypothetical protein
VKHVGKFKMAWSAVEFCSGSHESQEFTPLLEEAYSIKFDQEPLYGKFRFLLEQMLLSSRIKPYANFRFEFLISCTGQEELQ